MLHNNHHPPGLSTLVGRIGRLAFRAFHTRIELLTVEWQEERLRLADLLLRALALVFLVMMGALLLTATIIFLFPARVRLYVTAGLAFLYLLGAAGVWMGLKAGLRQEPFSESIDQVKKDRVWLESPN